MAGKKEAVETNPEKLRFHAENSRWAAGVDVASMSRQAVQALIRELQVHQIELELQNEELRMTQLELARTCDQYVDLYEYAPIGYLRVDSYGKILAANLTAAALFGLDRRLLVGERLEKYVDAEFRDLMYRHYRAAFSQSLKQVTDLKVDRPDGVSIYARFESVSMELADGSWQSRTTLSDITELKDTQSKLQRVNETLEAVARERTDELEYTNAQLREEIVHHSESEEALRQEKEFNETLIDTAQTIILVLDEDARIVSFNKYMERLCGYRSEEVRGKNWFETFLPEGERGRIARLFDRASRGVHTRGNINSIVTRGGEERAIEWYDSELRDKDNEFVGLLCTGQDVTERKTLQEQLLTIAENEQQRIGEHLHDDLGQELVALQLTVDTQIESLKSANSPEVERSLRVAEGLERSLRKVRDLARGLILFKISSAELVDALGDLCVQFNRLEDVKCTLDFHPAATIADDEVANQLYHIAKEALTNSLKHSRCDELHMSVVVGPEGENTVLTIRDNGKGISDEARSQGGSGLHIMKNRGDLIGATVQIGHHCEGGTVVKCIVQNRNANVRHNEDS